MVLPSIVWATMSIRDLIASMRKVATSLDEQGKAARTNPEISYKAREYFETANKLRDAADSLEYAIS